MLTILTPIKQKDLLYFLVLSLAFILTACQAGETPEPQPKPQDKSSDALSCEETFAYFSKLAFQVEGQGEEHDLWKWGQLLGGDGVIKIYVQTEDGSDVWEVFLGQLGAKVNQFLGGVRLEPTPTPPPSALTPSTLSVFISSPEAYLAFEPQASLEGRDSYFFIYQALGKIISASLWINSHAGGSERYLEHLLYKNFGHVLGLTNSSGDYSDSIFYDKGTSVNSYSRADRDMLRLLYADAVYANMNKGAFEAWLTGMSPQQLSLECQP
ncbi:MAG: DUF2927 domain-containing protein [Deinococcales bacterium]